MAYRGIGGGLASVQRRDIGVLQRGIRMGTPLSRRASTTRSCEMFTQCSHGFVNIGTKYKRENTTSLSLFIRYHTRISNLHNLHSRAHNWRALCKSRAVNCEHCEYWTSRAIQRVSPHRTDGMTPNQRSAVNHRARKIKFRAGLAPNAETIHQQCGHLRRDRPILITG